MKKQIVLAALSTTLMLSACSDDSTGENSREEQEQETQEQYSEEAGKADSIHQTVSDVIREGHTYFSEYLQHDNHKNENILETLEQFIPDTKEAAEQAENLALKEDLEDIHRLLINFQKRLHDKGESLNEREKRTRMISLLHRYSDLDYYARGNDASQPYYVTQYSLAQLDRGMHKTAVQEDIKRLPENVQHFIQHNYGHDKNAFIERNDFREALIEAYEQKGELQARDYQYIVNRMIEEGDTKAEVLRVFVEERM
ncbi:hypothetical protein SAMN05192534_12815 [Alteribacillus persepolensis]|uniref:Lipoprotein n=1 Tax=Alteribacillus persepolensis TaxID=568899 RepID=A0A1G8J2C9_9BACI|nr:hypothetical protein [Alteribacillus persepolensis]SDI25117.1 hypothetical protein SAMN05192534_12815 [Alteribacillus persepolensis]